MSGLGAAFGGSDELAKTKTETEMSDEQRAAIAWRMGLVNDYLYPFASQMPGGGDIRYGEPGWDERVRSAGAQYFANPPGDPFSLSSAGQGWTQGAQDYVSSAWPGLQDNPYAGGAGGWENPNLGRIFKGYEDQQAGLRGGFDETMAGLGDLYMGAIDRFSAPEQAAFTPEMFEYGNAVTEGGIKMDLGLLGGGASGGTAVGSEVGEIDERQAVARAQELFRDVVAPGMTAAASSAGLGRSGAEVEAQSMRGKEIALPISQQVLKHASDAALTEAKLATDASIATAGYATQASVANAQVRGRIAEMDYLQRATGALQAQALTAKSDAQRQQIMADVATLNAELRLKSKALGADMAKYGLGVGAHGAEFGFGTSADLEKFGTGMEMGAFGAGTQYQLESPGAILAMMNAGLSASEMQKNLQRGQLSNQQNLWLSLMGGVPFPGGGSTTSTQLDTGNFWDKWNQLHSDYAKLAMSASGAASGGGGAGGMGGGTSMFG